jgi:hypothetical protein
VNQSILRWLRGAAVVLIVCWPTWLAAQTPSRPWLIGAGLGVGSWFSQDVEAGRAVRDSRLLLGLQLEHTVAGPVSVALTGSVAAIPGACGGGCGSSGRGLDLSARVRLVSARAVLRISALGGVGVLDQGGSHARWHLGLGADLRGSARLGVRLEGRYLYTPNALPHSGYAILVGPMLRF